MSEALRPVSQEEMRAKVNAVEAHLRALPQTEIPVKHYYSKGVYAREIFIPAETIITGKIHKYQNLNIMSKGDISVLTDEGVIRVQAPFTIVSPPGTKRIAYTHTDTVWTTIHGTDEIDVDKIELEFIAQSDDEYLSFCKQLELK